MTAHTGVASSALVNYPRNAWWLAALSEEIGQDPYGCRLLDRPVLLYRKTDGTVTALDDRCPHRWAPLSRGKRVGDAVECRYHGFQFGPDGVCVKVPSQDHVPGVCKVYVYPVIEKDTLIWVWMGDLDRIKDAPPPPDIDFFGNAGWTTIHGYSDINCNYMLLQENVLDLTHFGFLHNASLGVTDWIKPPDVTVADEEVAFRQEFPTRPLLDGFAMTFGLPTGLTTHYVSAGTYLPPSVHIATETATLLDPNAVRKQFNMKIMHITTPMAMNKFRYYWFYGWDIDVPEPLLDGWRKMAPVFWAEDQDMIEAIADLVAHDSRAQNYMEVSVKADTAAIQARRLLQKFIDRD